MQRKNLSLTVLAVTAAFFISGCGQRAANNSQDAIEQAKSKGSAQEQVSYLVGQAKAFMQSEQPDEAMKVGNYILTELDQASQEAQDIMQTAKAELEKLAQQKAEELKGEANKAVDGLKDKIGSFGK